jgi:hypothetical protein
MRSATWPRGHRVEGRGVEPVDDEAPWPPMCSRAFAGRAFRGGLGGAEGERRLLDFFADESVAEVFRPALADGLRFHAFGEHEEGHVSQRPDLSRALRSVGWLSTQTVLMGANSSQRATPVMGNHRPWAYCQIRRIGLGFEGVIVDEGGLFLVGAVIARAGGDGAETFDGGDEREATLLRVSLMEDESVDLAAQRAQTACRRWPPFGPRGPTTRKLPAMPSRRPVSLCSTAPSLTATPGATASRS